MLGETDAARSYGVTAKVARHWVKRFRIEGSAGMLDHSSRSVFR
ncbi:MULTISPECIES: leucine zipper domain-containing protein [Mesorhizobium]|uniref:Leucine zipper domain-containing protein n=1 Tax=Mesorhizobium album TaxID=3072314 RepID=A0ABU4Y1T4_9HYPH|nr:MULTISPECIES: leucine zipper domain-containing protein [unclassified Mesorhizobium]MDX8480913.1 leucine zipper domain-containing protein [Mesorhizobium sp. VK24D]MDX8515159.1 leucine zipper domain-containing protein [Mesorhizobium sp. VK23E]